MLFPLTGATAAVGTVRSTASVSNGDRAYLTVNELFKKRSGLAYRTTILIERGKGAVIAAAAAI